jgi:DUF1009 family protein
MENGKITLLRRRAVASDGLARREQHVAGSAQNTGPIGLIAGNGRFPFYFARGAHRQGRKVVAVALRGEADPAIENEVDELTWVGIAQLGKWIRAFREAGVSQAAMCGGVTKGKMFDKLARLAALPDWRSIRVWYSRVRSRSDHTVLKAVAEELAGEGIELVSSVLCCPELLARDTCYTRRRAKPEEAADVAFAWPLAKEIARLQIGQTVVVKDRTVIAVEGIDGTDETLRRGGRLGRGNAVAAKVAKADHDERFDIPTIGPGTVDVLSEAGVRVLAVEAGKTLVLDEEDLVRRADRHGLTILGRR